VRISERARAGAIYTIGGLEMLTRLSHLQARILPRGPADVVRQVLVFAIAYYGYRWVRGAVDDPLSTSVAFQHAREVIHFERSLGVFVEPSMQAWAYHTRLIIDGASFMYLNAQVTVTVAALAYIYLRHNASFYFVRNMFAVAMLAALVGYIAFPTAPPRLLPEWGFVDSVSIMTGVPHDSAVVGELVNPYAAIPSMHVAFALMIAIPLARLVRKRAARVAWSLYPAVVTFVIISTANHFILDAVLGAITAMFAAWAAARLGRVRPSAWAFEPAKATV
jgi:hypothetical protein